MAHFAHVHYVFSQIAMQEQEDYKQQWRIYQAVFVPMTEFIKSSPTKCRCVVALALL